MVDEGLEIVRHLRARHDGTRRNRYSEIECGDHYSRAMAGWTVLGALSGLNYDGARKTLSLGSAAVSGDIRYPFVVGTGWGSFSRTRSATGWEIDITCAYGSVAFETLRLGGLPGGGSANLSLDGSTVASSPIADRDGVACSVPAGFTIDTGHTLRGTVTVS